METDALLAGDSTMETRVRSHSATDLLLVSDGTLGSEVREMQEREQAQAELRRQALVQGALQLAQQLDEEREHEVRMVVERAIARALIDAATRDVLDAALEPDDHIETPRELQADTSDARQLPEIDAQEDCAGSDNSSTLRGMVHEAIQRGIEDAAMAVDDAPLMDWAADVEALSSRASDAASYETWPVPRPLVDRLPSRSPLPTAVALEPLPSIHGTDVAEDSPHSLVPVAPDLSRPSSRELAAAQSTAIVLSNRDAPPAKWWPSLPACCADRRRSFKQAIMPTGAASNLSPNGASGHTTHEPFRTPFLEALLQQYFSWQDLKTRHVKDLETAGSTY